MMSNNYAELNFETIYAVNSFQWMRKKYYKEGYRDQIVHFLFKSLKDAFIYIRYNEVLE